MLARLAACLTSCYTDTVKRKLQLPRETVRVLRGLELRAVVGGENSAFCTASPGKSLCAFGCSP